MKTQNYFTTKVAILVITALVICSAANAQSTSINPIAKLTNYVKERKLELAESKLMKFTNMLEQKMKFTAPSVSDENSKAELLTCNYSETTHAYNCTYTDYNTNVYETEKAKKVVRISDANSFRNWLKNSLETNLGSAVSDKKGEMVVQFLVDENGKLSETVILKSSDKEVDNAVLKIMSNSPLWEPANQNGRNVKQLFYVPISYVIR